MADNAQSVLRRLREISDNPRLYLEMLTDRLANFNKGRVAEANRSGLGYRTLTPKERTEQMVGGALDNLGGGGLGALGTIRNLVPPRAHILSDILGKNHPVSKLLLKAEIPEKAIADWPLDVVSSPNKELLKSNVARRWETGDSTVQKGVAHYDVTGGHAIPQIIRDRRSNIEYGPLVEKLRVLRDNPEEYQRVLEQYLTEDLRKGRIKTFDLSSIPENKARYVPEDIFMEEAQPKEALSSVIFYPNEAEGLVTGLNAPSNLNIRDILNDPELRRAYNLSVSVPTESVFHRSARVFKKKGGLVQYKEKSCL